MKLRKSRRIFVLVFLTIFLVTTCFSQVCAVLGPVHVQLNITGERLGPSRANTATAFKIFFRINMNIEVHDWIKIWFPINETSCNPEDICGEPFEIKGYDESPRFVPNEKYFEKYDNPEEKEVGKLYEVLDEHDCVTDFFGANPCEKDEKEGNCRLVADPSGLGSWIMGTVLPALPRDRSDRKYRLAQIIQGANIGYYSPCSEGSGYPIIIQNCKESSYQASSPIGVEAWRQGYNPIDFNIAKRAGFITPATPGRYKLRIATRAEPTPVESDAFVLPCSEISELSVICVSNTKGDKSEFVFEFTTGEGGALDAGNSLVSIIFPEKLKLPEKIKPIKILMNGQPLRVKPRINQDANTIFLVSPADVDSFKQIRIEFKRDVGIVCSSENENLKFGLKTSSEPELVETTLIQDSNGLKEPLINNFKLNSYVCGDVFSATFSLDARFMNISTDTKFELIFPPGTKIQNKIFPGQFLVNDCSPVELKRLSVSRISFKISKNARIGQCQLRSIRFRISECAGIINPKTSGIYSMRIIINNRLMVSSESFTIENME